MGALDGKVAVITGAIAGSASLRPGASSRKGPTCLSPGVVKRSWIRRYR